MEFTSINPATEEKINSYTEHNSEQVDDIINRAHSTFLDWKETSFNHRAEIMLKTASLLLDKKEEAAQLMAVEMGKPISQGKTEIEKCAWVCSYYAEHSESFLLDKIIKTENSKSYVSFKPLGVIYAIMPWNYPFWQVFRFVAPNIMAGNTVILKHAPNVPQCSEFIYNIFVAAGLPYGAFEHILLSPKNTPSLSEFIIANDKIMGVTLTGSGRAGAFVAGLAGRNLKKSVLELGGSDPYIILADADIKKAAESCVISRMTNTGQTCIAAKRFIVDEKVQDDFITLFKQYSEEYITGNPLDEQTTMGPLARKDLQMTVHSQTLLTVKNGAKLILGGEIPSRTGYFYPPTILADVGTDSLVFSEEIFGPVASIISFRDETEAIAMANATGFGLGAAIFTSDVEKGEYLASNKLEAGACFVNQFVKSDPRLPFGGIKESGFGRELSEYGITEFLNIKTVVVD